MVFFCLVSVAKWTHRGLMVSALNSGSSGPGSALPYLANGWHYKIKHYKIKLSSEKVLKRNISRDFGLIGYTAEKVCPSLIIRLGQTYATMWKGIMGNGVHGLIVALDVSAT